MDRSTPSRRRWLGGTAAVGTLLGFAAWRKPSWSDANAATSAATPAAAEAFEVRYTDAQWKQRLTDRQYTVLRLEGTEPPFTSPLLNEHRAGTFTCAGCALALFSSKTKYESGTGWPSFWQPMERAVAERQDGSLGMTRTEIHCRRCGGHLGHVFDDGPAPTHLRYCMNGVSLGFTPGVA